MPIRNEKGVVLMMVLLIATITLSVTTTMLYMLLQSSKFSGMQKRYSSSAEAAMASTEVIRGAITNRFSALAMGKLVADVTFNNRIDGTPCVLDKLDKNTVNWDSSCDSSLTIITDPPAEANYDNSFILGDYIVYTKIVHTIEGNTGGSGGNVIDGAVDEQRFQDICVVHCSDSKRNSRGGSGDIVGQTIPAVYVIEVLAKHRYITSEISKLSILYQN